MFQLRKKLGLSLSLFLVSILVFLPIFNTYAEETIHGTTYDSCRRFSNGKIDFCIRNGERWFLFKDDFIRYVNLKNNRWLLCVNASPLRAQLWSSLSSSIDVEFNCSTRMIETLRTETYEGRFCEGPYKSATKFKRGELVNPVVSPTDPFGFLGYLSCNKQNKPINTTHSKKPHKKTIAKSKELSVVPSNWFEDTPAYCSKLGEIEKLCEDGNGKACFDIALAYEPHGFSASIYTQNGIKKINPEKHTIRKIISNVVSRCEGLKPNKKKMHEFSKKSCFNGYGAGCYKAGITEIGDEALEYFEKGSYALNPESCYEAGQFYLNGYSVNQDFSTARKFFEKGCDMSVGDACYYLGKLHEEGHGAWFFSKEKARSFFAKACDLGNREGCKKSEKLKK